MLRNVIGTVLLFIVALPSARADTRFEIRGGEVYDAQTKLIWARCSVGQEWKGEHCSGAVKNFTFDEAQQQGSHDGWRVPSKDELASLIDAEQKNFPTLDAKAFPDMDVNHPWYWSSTLNGNTIAWYVDFSDGYTSGFLSRSSVFAVRLVRNGQ